jgi:phage shock protein A/DNA-binding XRE family transcriptional regulator
MGGGVAMSYQLQMSEEVRAWLAGLQARELPAATLVGEAVTALLDEGAGLGAPLVVTVESALQAQDPGSALDYSYQRQLGMLQRVRRGVADIATARKRLELQITQLEAQGSKLAQQSLKAAEVGRDDLAQEARTRQAVVQDHLVDLRRLYADQQRDEEKATLAAQRLYAKVEAFRTRMETIMAAYTAGQAQATIEEALADIDEDDSDVPSADAAIAAARSAAETLHDSTHEFEQEAHKWPGQAEPHEAEDLSDLRELRLAALTGQDVRILFVIEAPDIVVLLAARDGHNQWWDWYDHALPLARELLSERSIAAELRSVGGAPHFPPRWREDAETVYTSYTKESFLDTFFPGQASELAAGAAQMVARNQVQRLTEVRRRLGLTQAQVASRMNVRQERVSAIERAEPGATEIRTLAAYLQALGGRLEIIADLGTERMILG